MDYAKSTKEGGPYMITMKEVLAQLKHLNFRPSFWTKPEISELPKILIPGERLMQVAMGRYNGGFALLCCTDQRVLLIDKKIFFLTLEDCRYDMIAEVMYQYRLLDATVTLTYASKALEFKSWNQANLRRLTTYIQQRVMEVRQYDQQHSLAPYSAIPLPTGAGLYDLPANQNFAGYEQQALANPIPKNPYQSRPYFRRRVSRFVTSSQLSR